MKSERNMFLSLDKDHVDRRITLQRADVVPRQDADNNESELKAQKNNSTCMYQMRRKALSRSPCMGNGTIIGG
jgi:hypothetical protein